MSILPLLRRLKAALREPNKPGQDWVEQFKKDAWQSSEAARVYVDNNADAENLQYYVQTTKYVETIRSYLGDGQHILDVGCGTGILTRALFDAKLKVSSMDISASMLGQLESLADGREVDTHVGDIFNLPFEDGRFDGLASRWVLPHFPDWPKAVGEMGKKLKPGGYLFFDFCNAENVKMAHEVGPIDVKSFGFCHDEADEQNQGFFYAAATQDQITASAADAGLELVDVKPTSFFVSNGAIAAAVGGEGYEVYKEGLKHHYMDPGARAFMEWFESFVTPRLPSPMVHGMCVVMRRPAV
jgi:ubiquinone/menaquinone biosynthesis C-methylase UbiE